MDDIYRQVLRLQNNTKDWLDNKAAAGSLLAEIQKLEDEIQMKKNPKTLEERARSVVRLLQRAAGEGSIDYHHGDELADQFEDIIQKLRKLA